MTFIALITGLVILAVVVSYSITICLSMLGFSTGRYLAQKCINKSTPKQFNEKGNPSQNCGNQSWYGEYIRYILNHCNDFWWTPILWGDKIRQSLRISKYYEGQNPRQNGNKKCPLNVSPNVVEDSLTQPTPKSHVSTLAQESEHVNQNGTLPSEAPVDKEQN